MTGRTTEVQEAPVADVGRSRDSGPWPEDLEKIEVGKEYECEVVLADDSRRVVPVRVSRIGQVNDSNGTATSGYVVSFEFDDPTVGGEP